MFNPESTTPQSESENGEANQQETIDTLKGIKKSDEVRSLIDESANVDYGEEGNRKMTEDLNCICAVLSGKQKLGESFEYQKHGTREGKRTQADSALKYLQKQGSVQALKNAAKKASFVSDELENKISSL